MSKKADELPTPAAAAAAASDDEWETESDEESSDAEGEDREAVPVEKTVEHFLDQYFEGDFTKDFGLADAKVTTFLLKPDDEELEDAAPEDEEERKAFLKTFVDEKMAPIGLTQGPTGKIEEALEPLMKQAYRMGNTDTGSTMLIEFTDHAERLLTRAVACVELHKNKSVTAAQAQKATFATAAELTPVAVVSGFLELYTVMFDFDYWVHDNEIEDEDFILPMKFLNTAMKNLMGAFPDDTELGLVGSCSRNSIKQSLADRSQLFVCAAGDRDGIADQGMAPFAPDDKLWVERVAKFCGSAAAVPSFKRKTADESGDGLEKKRLRFKKK